MDQTLLSPSTIKLALRTVLLGIAQIVFGSRPIAGLIILLAVALHSWQMAFFVIAGSVASAVAGFLLKVHSVQIATGLQGYCGALAGAACYVALGWTWLGFVVALLAGLVCGPLTWGLARLFASRSLAPLGLPVLTAPFCLVAGAMFLLTSGHHVESAPVTLPESVVNASAWFAGPWFDSYFGVFARSVFSNISQVMLIDNVAVGLLILLALLLAQWKLAAGAFVGSIVSSFLATAVVGGAGPKEAVVLGSDFEVPGSRIVWLVNPELIPVNAGLFGYSGVLVGIALAAVFISGSWQPWVAAGVGAALATVVSLLARDLHGVYTWPFVLVTWLMIAVIYALRNGSGEKQVRAHPSM